MDAFAASSGFPAWLVFGFGSALLLGLYDVAKKRSLDGNAVTAVWANETGDGEETNPANWTCRDADGVVIWDALPSANTVVTVPYSTSMPDATKFDHASLVMSISGTVAPRGTCIVPDVMKEAIAWYDLDDTKTVAATVEGVFTSIVNKGTAGSDLDGELFSEDQRAAYGLATTAAGRNVLSLTNAFGFVSKSASGISGDQDRTIIAVSRRLENVYPKTDKPEEFYNELFPIGLEYPDEHWGVTHGQFRIADTIYGMSLAYGNGVNADDQSQIVSATLSNFPRPASGDWQIYSMMADNMTVSATRVGEDGVIVAATPAVSNGLGTDGASKIYVGIRRQYASTSAGEIAEAMVFDKALSGAELDEVRAYLAEKWLASPEVDMASLPANIAFEGENAVYNLGGGSWTFDGIAGAGTISNANVTVTDAITITVNSDGTIDPLVIDGSLTLGANAKLVVNGARYLTTTQVTALTAMGGVTGEFATVETDNGRPAKVKYANGVVTVAKRFGFSIIIQ